MARSKQKQSAQPKREAKAKAGGRAKLKAGGRVYPPQPAGDEEVVEPMWLVKAIGLTLVAALVCGYLALCLLFYQGQWQLVLHPAKKPAGTVDLGGIAAETIRFGTDESAVPQRTGIYIPAASGARYGAKTVLYLPSGDGQLADRDGVATLEMLHSVGLNVFAFDYRGYGMSVRANPGQSHPNEQRMEEDAASAWQYLTVSRGVRASEIIPYGTGVGAALATGLAERYSGVPAVVVDSPRPDLLEVIRRDPRSSLLPVRLLFHDRFEISDTLASMRTPKFVVLRAAAGAPEKTEFNSVATDVGAVRRLAIGAAEPKFVLSLGTKSPTRMLPDALGRFLDQYLHPAM